VWGERKVEKDQKIREWRVESVWKTVSKFGLCTDLNCPAFDLSLCGERERLRKDWRKIKR
jgi:hypothetical protein